MTVRTVLAVAVLSMGAAAGAAAQKPVVNNAADEAAIAALSDREMVSFSAGTVDSNIALLSDDAVILPPNGPMLSGKDAIRKWAADTVNRYRVSGKYTDRKIIVSGDWASERFAGELSLTPKAGGAAITERIKGIHILRRQPDGSWKIAQDVWNTDTPPPLRRRKVAPPIATSRSPCGASAKPS